MIDTPHAGRALIVVVVDHPEEETNRIGNLVTELLLEDGFLVDGYVPVASDEAAVRKALDMAIIGGVDLVVTIGGVGVGPRDIVPQVTEQVLDSRLPGISQAICSSALGAGAVDAVASRGVVGISGGTVIVNLACSRPAIRDGMATLCPLVAFVIAQLSDSGHEELPV